MKSNKHLYGIIYSFIITVALFHFTIECQAQKNQTTQKKATKDTSIVTIELRIKKLKADSAGINGKNEMFLDGVRLLYLSQQAGIASKVSEFYYQKKDSITTFSFSKDIKDSASQMAYKKWLGDAGLDETTKIKFKTSLYSLIVSRDFGVVLNHNANSEKHDPITDGDESGGWLSSIADIWEKGWWGHRIS